MTDRLDLIAGNLQNQIAQMAARYETEIATIKTDAAIQIDGLQNEIKRLKEKYEPVEDVPGGEEGTGESRGPAVPAEDNN